MKKLFENKKVSTFVAVLLSVLIVLPVFADQPQNQPPNGPVNAIFNSASVGDLSIDENGDLSKANGPLNLAGDLVVTGDVGTDGDLAVTGDLSSKNLAVTGTADLGKLKVDADGNLSNPNKIFITADTSVQGELEAKQLDILNNGSLTVSGETTLGILKINSLGKISNTVDQQPVIFEDKEGISSTATGGANAGGAFFGNNVGVLGSATNQNAPGAVGGDFSGPSGLKASSTYFNGVGGIFSASGKDGQGIFVTTSGDNSYGTFVSANGVNSTGGYFTGKKYSINAFADALNGIAGFFQDNSKNNTVKLGTSAYAIDAEGGFNLSGDSNLSGDLDLSGDFSATGNMSVSGNISATGNVVTNGNISATKITAQSIGKFSQALGAAVTLNNPGIFKAEAFCPGNSKPVSCSFYGSTSTILISSYTDLNNQKCTLNFKSTAPGPAVQAGAIAICWDTNK